MAQRRASPPREQRTMAEIEKETHKVQAETIKTISMMINVNVDTLETVGRQIEMTEGDLRKLASAQEDLNESQRLLNQIRRGIFSFGSTAKAKPLPLPNKMDGHDKDFQCKVGGRNRLVRLSTVMYVASESANEFYSSVPYQYVDGCVVKKDMKSVSLFFRGCYAETVGTKPMVIDFKAPALIPEFVRELKDRILQKGAADSTVRDEVRDKMSAGTARGDALFTLAFEDPSKAFVVQEDIVKKSQGIIQDLMRDYKDLETQSKKDGKQGAIEMDQVTDLTLRGLDIISSQLGDIKDDLEQHMKLLIQEEQMMMSLTIQADSLTQQNKELLAKDECCCVIL
eukprot:TRINITY_DN17212_c0_g1_i4.p1 TRINITY_DN17212_c0_g1~~TRINITY_DN17212_c0_g1_i4.p1  ORF type:complete len:340 (+),score=100.94 TRINITY_DN17212_c0_g1_i4:212-1231(+)